ncbi:MAG: thiamine phosphate synthase [Bacteroidales bacterium]|nr:thiamine phosphate synthase [Bacteroidales bacterium]
MSDKKTFNPALYLVTDRDLSLGRSLDWVVEKAVKGGTTVVQLREKKLDTKAFIEEASHIKKILKSYDVPLLINDRVDVALAVGADGVHLGQKDMPYEMARRIMGKETIIGLSVESYEQAKEAGKLDLDYIAISPVYTTPTKEELTEELGLEGVRRITEICRHPSVGIGSIKAHNAGEVIQAGADGVAVVSGICSADDPEHAAKELRQAVDKARMHNA